jgi:microcystin-dependent protein
MAVPIPVSFHVATPPADNPGNIQELLNAIGGSLAATFVPAGNYILGQMDGVLPSSNVGPWANNDEWWFWSASQGTYVRSADGVPVGMMTWWGGEGAPDNWIVCDGSELARTGIYNALFQVIGGTWGTGDGVTTFNLPPGAMFYVNDDQFHADGVVPLIQAASNGFSNRQNGWGIQGGAQVAALLSDQNMPALSIKVNFAWTGIDSTGGAGAVSNLYPANQTNLTPFSYQVLAPNGTPLNSQAQTQFSIMPPFAAANLIIKFQ